jgi:hypothetical protein
VKEARTTQCFRCQGYGHVARACRHEYSCANCAGKHDTRECTQKDAESRKWTHCKGKHGAWDRRCRYRQKEIEKVAMAKTLAPRYFYESTRKDTNTPDLGEIRGRAEAPSSEGWAIIARPRGRPSAILKAASNPRQSQLQTLGKRTASNMSPPPVRERTGSPNKKTKEVNPSSEEETNNDKSE